MRMSRFQALAGAAGGVALLAVAASPASASPAPAAAPAAAGGRCAVPLPATVVGDPGVTAGAASGARVWHDASGWHVRFTHPGTGTEVFTGVIRSPQPISVRGYRLEAGDSFQVRNRRHTVTFRFVNHGAVDGLDLTDRCAINTSFTLYRDGRRLSANDIYLGAGGAHPTSNPFLVQRR